MQLGQEQEIIHVAKQPRLQAPEEVTEVVAEEEPVKA